MKRFQMSAVTVALALGAFASTTDMTAKPVRLSGEIERQAKLAAEYNLKDPSSAMYRMASTYRLENGDYVFCTEQNARNGFGGFTGFKHVFVRFALGANQPTRKVEVRELLAQNACDALRRGRSIPIRNT